MSIATSRTWSYMTRLTDEVEAPPVAAAVSACAGAPQKGCFGSNAAGAAIANIKVVVIIVFGVDVAASGCGSSNVG